MPERKVWTEEQDRILKLLKEERNQHKWASIARIMQTEFNISGRNGKQCRERYHNHLDQSIINTQWTKEQEQILFQLHGQVGNKWSVISHQLPGRSDNCVKNHFYSKLRKAMRRLNKLIQEHLYTQHKCIKEAVISRIVKTTESKFKNNPKIQQHLADFSNSIKNRLFQFQFVEGQEIEDVDFARKVIADIETFDRDYKKVYKGIKDQFEYEYKTYLKPPPKVLKKHSSTQSQSSMKSEDSSSSYLSSNSSYLSSSDLSQFLPVVQQRKNKKKPPGAKSLGTTSGRCSEEISKSEKNQEKLIDQNFQGKMELQNQHILKPSKFEVQYEYMIMDDSQIYDRGNGIRDIGFGEMSMNCDQTPPQIGSILAPREIYEPFYLQKDEHDNQDIEFKAQQEKMDIQ